MVSIDGLQLRVRRAGADAGDFYDCILKHIAGQHVTVHCTLDASTARPGYVDGVHGDSGPPTSTSSGSWFSLHIAQKRRAVDRASSPRGSRAPRRGDRAAKEGESKLHDNDSVRRARIPLHPPQTPVDCIFAKTTACCFPRICRPKAIYVSYGRHPITQVRVHGIGGTGRAGSILSSRRHSAEDDLRRLTCAGRPSAADQSVTETGKLASAY